MVTQANAPQSKPQPSISGPTCPPVKIIRQIPKASRAPAGRKLINILEAIVNTNAPAAWDCLLHLGMQCFRAPPRGSQRWSLATSINQQLSEESLDPSPINMDQRPWDPSHNPLSHMPIWPQECLLNWKKVISGEQFAWHALMTHLLIGAIPPTWLFNRSIPLHTLILPSHHALIIYLIPYRFQSKILPKQFVPFLVGLRVDPMA